MPLLSAPGQSEQDGAHADDQDGRAQPVDAVLTPVVRDQPQHLVVQDQREDADRQVDVEDPAPVVLGEVAADQWSGHRGQAEHGAEQALVPAAVAGREHVRDDRERERHQPARAQSLDAPGHHELGHVLRGTGQQRAHQERRDREQQDRAPPVQVADLAVQRGGRGGRQQVRGHDPRVVLDTAELADDGRQGGADDGLVERGQQHAGHEPAHQQQDLPVRQRRPGVLHGHGGHAFSRSGPRSPCPIRDELPAIASFSRAKRRANSWRSAGVQSTSNSRSAASHLSRWWAHTSTPLSVTATRLARRSDKSLVRHTSPAASRAATWRLIVDGSTHSPFASAEIHVKHLYGGKGESRPEGPAGPA